MTVVTGGVTSSKTLSPFPITRLLLLHLVCLSAQSKFPESVKHEEGWNPKHGIRLECACIVILNALGYIGFKVVTTSGDRNEYMWTVREVHCTPAEGKELTTALSRLLLQLERNLDMDSQYQAIERSSYNQ